MWQCRASHKAIHKFTPEVRNQAMSSNEFSASPLITRERLEVLDRAEAFSSLPAWAAGGILLSIDPGGDSGLELEFDVFEVPISGVCPLIARFPAISAAILFELTRYGNSIATNRNRIGGEVYAKLTFGQHAKDSMPAARIIMDALPRQAVFQMGNPGEYRPEYLEKRGAGKSIKDARTVAIKHALEAALEARADALAYEANLLVLLEFHDELLLGRFAY